MINSDQPVLILGGNDLASAVALSLFRCSLPVVMCVNASERNLRYHLSFGDAAILGERAIESITATTLPEELLGEVPDAPFSEKVQGAIRAVLLNRQIPVIHQFEAAEVLEALSFSAIIAARPPLEGDPDIESSGTLIGLLPQATPGVDCHAAVETRLNFDLGRIYIAGEDLPHPAGDAHFFKQPFQLCKTPVEGVWTAIKEIGEEVRFNEPIGKIGDIEIRSPYDGQLWGLAHSGLHLARGEAVAQIYQAQATEEFRRFGFRELAVARGVMEAILRLKQSS